MLSLCNTLIASDSFVLRGNVIGFMRVDVMSLFYPPSLALVLRSPNAKLRLGGENKSNVNMHKRH